jgi:hypothetical protein
MTDSEPPSPEVPPDAVTGGLTDEVRRLLARPELWLVPPPELLRAVVDCIAAESLPREPP